MSELSKFINLVIEYGEKIQTSLNKKYKPFIRSICNLQNLAKNVDPNKIVLTKQAIIFKLGLEAKSQKSIEISLNYLHKFFTNKFIDLGVPNYCEEYIIEQTTVRKVQKEKIEHELKHQLMKWLQPLIHYKSNEINQLSLRVYEFLIAQRIAPLVIELNLNTPTQLGNQILFNYYSYRFLIYQEVYTLLETEFKSINALCIRNKFIDKQIQSAFQNHEELLDLVHKYIGEMTVAVAGIGGKYGLCIICRQPANYYCKVTKASLCGPQCKKRHLFLAETEYKKHFQAHNLWIDFYPNFQLLLQYVSSKQSHNLLSVLVSLLQKPHIFMIVNTKFRHLIGKYSTPLINCLFNYKGQNSFQLIYSLFCSLCRYWMVQSLSGIEYFFKQSIIKILEGKRPNIKILMIVFKSLAKIFQYGKTLIELYVNFDCELNKTNIIEKLMFQLSKICQDKFGNSMYYNKQQKAAIKNSCVTLFTIIGKGLNEYRLHYDKQAGVQPILGIKQKKTNLQKFILKFNEHWSSGLKTLFNLNMVGLQSRNQIADILLSTKGLKKQNIQQLLVSEAGQEYLQNIFNKIQHIDPFLALIQLYRIIPLKKSSIKSIQLFAQDLSRKHFKKTQNKQEADNIKNDVFRWFQFLSSNFKLDDLNLFLFKQNKKFSNQMTDHVYMKCLQMKNELTIGSHKSYFTHCSSGDYVQIFTNQITLLQIPVLYLLQTSYDVDKIIQLAQNLMQVCVHANWITLLLKNADIQKLRTNKFTQDQYKLVVGTLKLVQNHPDSINDWPNILNFMNKLYKLITSNQKIVIQTSQSKPQFSNLLTVAYLQECFIQIGKNIDINFPKLIGSMTTLAKQQILRENIFILQRMFQLIQTQKEKFIKYYKQVMPYLNLLINTKAELTTEILIYIADMIKQSFAKILKNQKQVSKNLQLQFFKLFESIIAIKNKEVNDFVMNSISMIIMHQYNLHSSSWIVIFKIMKANCKNHRQQVHTILQKVIQQKMRCCQQLQQDLINLCLQVVDEKQVKLSIQAIHSIKNLSNLFIQQLQKFQEINNQFKLASKKKELKIVAQAKIQQEQLRQEESKSMDENKDDGSPSQQEQQQAIKTQNQAKKQGQKQLSQSQQKTQNTQNIQSTQNKEKVEHAQQPKIILKKIQVQKQQNLKQLQDEELIQNNKYRCGQIKKFIMFIQHALVEFISYDCHQGAIQILFLLLKTKVSGKMFFNFQEVDEVISKIFIKLESLPKNLISRGEKIMNQSLFWSVRNHNKGIIKNLQNCIIDKYSKLSYTSMKCIKTYISMTNPKQKEQWKPIQQTLIKILKNTHLSQIYQREEICNIDQLLQSGKSLPDEETFIESGELSNKLIIQRMIVQVLPNDIKIIDQLLQIYNETIKFNDNLYLRCLLWRQGLGQKNKLSPPDILSLEQLISYRIISTYYWGKQYANIIQFTLQILDRYCQASKKWQQLQRNTKKYQDEGSNVTFQIFAHCKQYWKKRRLPLVVIINYMLPKLPKICRQSKEKQKMVYCILQSMKFCQERGPYLDAIRQLAIM